MKQRNWRALPVVITLVLAALVTVVQTLPPSPLPAGAPATEFSAERAIEHIRVIATQPRPTGSPGNTAARNYILAVLKDLGLETVTQQDGTLENVMGRMAGSSSSEAVLLTAHLDSVAESPGATDDASGVAVLLETARALKSTAPLRNTVIFLFTDDEESGTIGARAFIADAPWRRDVRVVIGLDAGGLRGPAVLSATSPNNGWLIRQLARADAYISGSSAINALAESGTDFGQAFKAAGFRGYAFDLYWDRRIHTPEDNIENLSPSSIQYQGYHALSLVQHFGNLEQLTDPKETDVVYFSVLRLFIVAYPSDWAIPLAMAVTVLFSGLLVYGLRQRILTWGELGFGMLALLGGLVLAPLPSILLDQSMPGVPFRFIGRGLDQPWQVGAVVLIMLSLTILWYGLSRRIRRTSLADLGIGAMILLLAGTIGTSIAFPALSFAFTWPMLFSLLAFTNWFVRTAGKKKPKMVIISLILAGAADIIILVPTILLGLFEQMSLTLLLLGVLCGFLVPQIQLMLGRALENHEQAQGYVRGS